MRAGRKTACRIALLLIPLAGWGQAWSWTPDEIVEGIQRRYQEIRDLQADFHQMTTLPMMDRAKEASGRLYLKIPGKMRWDYLQGQQKTVIINQHTLWFYDPSARQVTVTDLSRVANAGGLLTFLTGVGDLRRDFRLDTSNPLAETPGGYVMVRLFPKEGTSQWTRLQLLVEPKRFQVIQTSFVGVQGDLTVIDYTNIRTDLGLPDALFKFEIPEGVDVLHYPPPERRP